MYPHSPSSSSLTSCSIHFAESKRDTDLSGLSQDVLPGFLSLLEKEIDAGNKLLLGFVLGKSSLALFGEFLIRCIARNMDGM